MVDLSKSQKMVKVVGLPTLPVKISGGSSAVTHQANFEQSGMDGGFVMWGTYEGATDIVNPSGTDTSFTPLGTATKESFLAVYDYDATNKVSLRWAVRLTDSTGAVTLYSCVPTLDGGFVIAGAVGSAASITLRDASDSTTAFVATAPSLSGSVEMWWAKYDSNGDPVWIQQQGFTGGTLSNLQQTQPLGGGSLSLDGETVIFACWSHNAHPVAAMDIVTNDFGNGVTFDAQAHSGGVNITHDTYLAVHEDDGEAQVVMLARAIGGSGRWERNEQTGGVSRPSSDGKVTVVGKNGSTSSATDRMRMGENTASPIVVHDFNRAQKFVNHLRSAPYISQVDPDTLIPDWIVTAGRKPSSTYGLANGIVQQNMKQIARDDDGNTYWAVVTNTHGVDGNEIQRSPTAYGTAHALVDDACELISVDNTGAIRWTKRIQGTSNTNQQEWYNPQIEISGDNVVMVAQIKSVGSLTYSVGDPESTVVANSALEIHITTWLKSDGTFQAINKHGTEPNEDSKVFCHSQCLAAWESGPREGQHALFAVAGQGSSDLQSVQVGGTLIENDFVNQKGKGYVKWQDSANADDEELEILIPSVGGVNISIVGVKAL